MELSGGASTAYSSEGASVRVHARDTEASVGLGVVQGGFAAGGALSRKLGNSTFTLGQQELHMDLPTDVFDTTHFLFATGLGMTRVRGDVSVQSFVGWASQEGGTPLFRAARLGKPTQFLQGSRPVGSGCGISLTELLGEVSAALLGVKCDLQPDLTVAASLGEGAGSPYAAVSTVWKRRHLRLRASYLYANEHFQRGNNPFQPTPEPIRENVALERELSHSFSISGEHGNFLTAAGTYGQTGNTPNAVIRSSLDSASLQFHRQHVNSGVSLLHSSFSSVGAAAQSQVPPGTAANAAITANVTYTRRRWQFGQTLLYSLENTASARTAILSNTFAFEVSPRLRLTEAVNVSSTGTTFSHGGRLLTRFSSVEVDYQFFYVASRPDQPFQQGLLLNADLQLPRSFALKASSTLDALGRPRYTVQVGKALVHNQSASSVVQTSFGESVVRGRVVDEHGTPVEGAALAIGEEHVYTDSSGLFQFRERRPAAHTLTVLTDEFIAVGAFAVVSAPATVRSGPDGGIPLRIVVRTTHAVRNATMAVARPVP